MLWDETQKFLKIIEERIKISIFQRFQKVYDPCMNLSSNNKVNIILINSKLRFSFFYVILNSIQNIKNLKNKMKTKITMQQF